MRARRTVIVGVVSTLATLVGALPALAAPVSVGQSGWTWGDPTPQGENLADVVFAGARGYAVGDFGTVLRSDDGGNTWIGLPSGTGNNLSLVQEVEPNTVVVGGGCTVRESVNAGASFQRLPVDESEGKCSTTIASFSFLSASTGFVEQADGAIFLTTDGGQTLTPKTSVPLNGETAGKLEFISPSTGFAVTGGNGGGRIFRTTDGADSWTQVASSPAPLADITFVTPTMAYAVGQNSTLLQSTNEGITWQMLPLALPAGTPPLSLTHISCSDEMHCLIATAPASGANTNMLVRTTDGGMTGTLVSPSEQNLLSVSFSTASDAVAVGQNGATVLSTDGGATFPTLISHRLGAVFSSVIRIGQSPMDAYVPGLAGQIAATTNGGANWSVLRVPTSVDLQDVAFPTPEIGYAVGSNGTVFRTANAGLSWSILSSGGGTTVTLLAPNSSTLLLTGPRGVRRSTNSGASFAAVNTTIAIGRHRGKVRTAKLSSFDLSRGGEVVGTAVFAYGNDVLESINGGSRWTLIPRPLPKRPVTAISFVSPTTGYEASAGRLFFTSDSGRHWKEILSVGSPVIDEGGQLSFSSVSDGYVLRPFDGGSSIPLRTEDGGRTWTPEILPNPIAAVAAAGSVDYAAGSPPAGGLFQTTDGGLSSSPSTLTLAIVGPRKLSVAKLKRAGGQVRLEGHLSPALEGEIVVISYLTNGSWHSKNVTVSASGAFALAVPGIGATTDFVAQWTGNDLVSGAGTVATQLTVSHRRMHKRAG